MDEGLIDPPSVIKYTQDYWENNDVYGIFISERVSKVYRDDKPDELDLTSTITMNDLLQEFKLFFRVSYPNDTLPGRDLIRTQFCKRWGRYPKGGWQGYAIVDGDNLIAPFLPSKMN